MNTTYFSETWDKLHTILDGLDKNTPLLTYCTGGIRCVKVTTHFLHIKASHFMINASLYLFDFGAVSGQRVPAAEDGVHQHAPSAGRHHCIRGMGKRRLPCYIAFTRSPLTHFLSRRYKHKARTHQLWVGLPVTVCARSPVSHLWTAWHRRKWKAAFSARTFCSTGAVWAWRNKLY